MLRNKKMLFISFNDSYKKYNESVFLGLASLLKRLNIKIEILYVEQKFFKLENGSEISLVSDDFLKKINSIMPDYISALNAGYLWGCNVSTNNSLYNNPLSLIKIPVVALWDNNLTQLVNFTGLSLDIIKTILDSDNIFNFSHDKGDINDVKSIFGRELKNNNIFNQSLPHVGILFNKISDIDENYDFDLTHCGNINLDDLERFIIPENNDFDTLSFFEEIKNFKMNQFRTPVFEIYKKISKERAPFLSITDFMFWRLYDASLRYLNTKIRLEIFSQIDFSINFWGAYVNQKSRDFLRKNDHVTYHGYVPWGRELGKIYKRSKINLIVSNSINQNGISPKLIECLMAGGFPLIDEKDALNDYFGKVIDEITFSSIDDLKEKIKFYQKNNTERLRLLHQLRERIFTDYYPAEKSFKIILDNVDNNYKYKIKRKISLHSLVASIFNEFLCRFRIPTYHLKYNNIINNYYVKRKLNISLFYSETDWVDAGAKIQFKGNKLFVRTTTVAWGYSSMLKLDLNEIDWNSGSFFLKVVVSNVKGYPLISVLDVKNNLIFNESSLAEKNFSQKIFFPLRANGGDVLLVRNGEYSKSSTLLLREVSIVKRE